MASTSRAKASQTYRAAGVDRDASTAVKQRIARAARTTFTPDVVGDIGGFGSLYRLSGFKDPVLVSHTDSVGTKVRVGALFGRYDTLGEDIVHHCVNDIFTCGAKPLFFLDYIAMGKLAPEKVEALVLGMVRACRAIDCSLIGGETAEMPGIYQGEDAEVVGFVVGAVERDALLDGADVRTGDVLLGLPSSGLHTNGFSLVRQVFDIDREPGVLQREVPELGVTLGESLLVPHRCYYPLVAPSLGHIKAMAHITGGGLLENVPRVLPENTAAHFRAGAWEVPPIFRFIQEQGRVAEEEMYRVFNMGIGMVLVVGPESVAPIQAKVPEARVIGEVVDASGRERVRIEGVTGR